MRLQREAELKADAAEAEAARVREALEEALARQREYDHAEVQVSERPSSCYACVCVARRACESLHASLFVCVRVRLRVCASMLPIMCKACCLVEMRARVSARHSVRARAARATGRPCRCCHPALHVV